GDLTGPRAGALPAHFHDVGSFAHHLQAVGDGGLRVEPASTVGERARGDVQDTHDQRTHGWNLLVAWRNGVLPAVDELHGFVAGGHAVPELPFHRRSDGDGTRLAHAAHRHAEVLGLDDDEHTPRL